jgi:uncharacterized membrane protein
MTIAAEQASFSEANPELSNPEFHQPACSANVGNLERLASVAGGTGLVAIGLSRRSISGLALAAVGGALVYRGATGHCYLYDFLGINTAQEPGEGTVVKNGIRVRLNTQVEAPAESLYSLWRDFNNLPRFMDHLQAVEVIDPLNSHWVVKGPADMRVEWDAEIINERDGEMISWRSLPGGDVDHAGSVRFVPAGDNRTDVQVELNYLPPAGYAGAALAWVLGDSAEQQIREDLEKFKSFAESQARHTPQPAASAPAMDAT